MSYRTYKDYHKTINGIEHKQCKGCEDWFPMTLEYYGKDKGNKDGLNTYCKICQKTNNTKYYQENREQQLEYQKQYQKEHWPEQHNRFIKWYEQNREYNNQWCVNWRKENHDYKREYEKNYYINNPDKFKVYAENQRIHDITKTEQEALLKIFNYSCAYCGITLQEHKRKYKSRLHNDHVDFNGANDLSNDVPACKSCNSQKRISDMEDWYRKQEFFCEEKLQFIKWWIKEGYKDYIEDKPPYKILRKQNEDKRTYHFELWTVDDMRNLIETVAIENKKKDLDVYIKDYLKFTNQTLIF